MKKKQKWMLHVCQKYWHVKLFIKTKIMLLAPVWQPPVHFSECICLEPHALNNTQQLCVTSHKCTGYLLHGTKFIECMLSLKMWFVLLVRFINSVSLMLTKVRWILLCNIFMTLNWCVQEKDSEWEWDKTQPLNHIILGTKHWDKFAFIFFKVYTVFSHVYL